MIRRTCLAGILALPLMLAACKKEPEAPAVPNMKAGIEIANARLVLPVISGSAAAAYFTITNTTAQTVTISTIDVRGAKMAMMHETAGSGAHSTMSMLAKLDVPAESSVTFAPGGKHVMLTGLDAGLKPGGKARMIITFDDGDRAAADLAILPATSSGE